MYYLGKLDIQTCNGSVLKHPVNVILKSEDIIVISEKIKSLIKNGCPAENLVVFKNIEFEVLCGVRFAGESEG